MDGKAIGPARVIALSGAREFAALLYQAAAAGDADAAFVRFLCEELGRDLGETTQMLEEFRRLPTLAHTDG
jgi:hypothetical protein